MITADNHHDIGSKSLRRHSRIGIRTCNQSHNKLERPSWKIQLSVALLSSNGAGGKGLILHSTESYKEIAHTKSYPIMYRLQKILYDSRLSWNKPANIQTRPSSSGIGSVTPEILKRWKVGRVDKGFPYKPGVYIGVEMVTDPTELFQSTIIT